MESSQQGIVRNNTSRKIHADNDKGHVQFPPHQILKGKRISHQSSKSNSQRRSHQGSQEGNQQCTQPLQVIKKFSIINQRKLPWKPVDPPHAGINPLIEGKHKHKIKRIQRHK